MCHQVEGNCAYKQRLLFKFIRTKVLNFRFSYPLDLLLDVGFPLTLVAPLRHIELGRADSSAPAALTIDTTTETHVWKDPFFIE